MTSPVPAGKVRIYPMPGSFLEGVPRMVQDVDPETAERLCAPISRHDDATRFVTDAALLPDGWEPPDPDHLVTEPPAPAEAPAPARRPARTKPTPAPADAGAPDSEVTG